MCVYTYYIYEYCVYVCMYVCMYAYIYIYIYIYIYTCLCITCISADLALYTDRESHNDTYTETNI